MKTLVFSADAADEKLYSELRVNGNLKVLKNIEKFQNIKEKKYSKIQLLQEYQELNLMINKILMK